MVIYRRGLKENVKDELIRTGALINTLERLEKEAIRIDDILYERAIEKRHILSKGAFNSYGRTGGGRTYRDPDAIELDAI